MGSLNKVMLIGRLGRDPEISYTPNGSALAKFSLATSDHWVDRNGNKQERTEWHNLIAWNRLADLVQNYLRKGSLVYIEGQLRTHSWENQAGEKRYKTEIDVRVLQFLEPRGQERPGYDSFGSGQGDHQRGSGQPDYQRSGGQPDYQRSGGPSDYQGRGESGGGMDYPRSSFQGRPDVGRSNDYHSMNESPVITGPGNPPDMGPEPSNDSYPEDNSYIEDDIPF